MSDDDTCICLHYRYEHRSATDSGETGKCTKCSCPKFALDNR